MHPRGPKKSVIVQDGLRWAEAGWASREGLGRLGQAGSGWVRLGQAGSVWVSLGRLGQVKGLAGG